MLDYWENGKHASTRHNEYCTWRKSEGQEASRSFLAFSSVFPEDKLFAATKHAYSRTHQTILDSSLPLQQSVYNSCIATEFVTRKSSFRFFSHSCNDCLHSERIVGLVLSARYIQALLSGSSFRHSCAPIDSDR